MIKYTYALACILLVFFSCEDNTTPVFKDNFDREELIANWIDRDILPGFEKYAESLQSLEAAHQIFSQNNSSTNLESLQMAFLEAYKRWQYVAMFEIGEAQILNLRNFTNIYPTDVDKIEEQIAQGEYNFSLPSTFATQGFPALDYLLFEKIESETLSEKLPNGDSVYLEKVIKRLVSLGTLAKEGWTNDYRQKLINDPTAVDRIVNDYIYYLEKFLRAGKVGIPAGVFSGNALGYAVEAPFSQIYSRDLLLEALTAVQDFFNDESLDSYLEFMDKSDIAMEINQHLDKAKGKIESLHPNLQFQIETDNSKMLEVYDELQKAVILMKVDMLSILSIQVDYVDADGD